MNLKYIELKSGYSDNGPAWIARVNESKSGRTVYFDDKALKKGQGISGNYFDLETGEEYWISGIRKRGSNRHYAGSGKIRVEHRALGELLALLEVNELDSTLYEICESLRESDIQRLSQLENARLVSNRAIMGHSHR